MRYTRWIAAVCALGLTFAGCGRPKPSDEGGAGPSGAKTLVVGASLLTQTHVFYQDMVAAMQEEAARQGLKLRLQYAEFDSRRQNDQIETLIAQGVDALMVAPTDSSGVTPVFLAVVLVALVTTVWASRSMWSFLHD